VSTSNCEEPEHISEAEDAKYLGLYLDRRLNLDETYTYQAKTTWT